MIEVKYVCSNGKEYNLIGDKLRPTNGYFHKYKWKQKATDTGMGDSCLLYTSGGMTCDVNNTVYNKTVKDHGIVGDFQNAFKWGFSKEIPLEIIQYGDPDNSGKDLKGYNQVYIRAEVYIGWGILVPEFFGRIVEA